MTFAEWSRTLVDELRRGGFDASVYCGFPFVRIVRGLPPRAELEAVWLPVEATRRFYATGMILYPPAGLVFDAPAAVPGEPGYHK